MITELPAFRVTYDNGKYYVTSMALGTTVAEAEKYFLGKEFEYDEGPLVRVVLVEPASIDNP